MVLLADVALQDLATVAEALALLNVVRTAEMAQQAPPILQPLNTVSLWHAQATPATTTV